MTVRELIKALEQCDPDQEVVIAGPAYNEEVAAFAPAMKRATMKRAESVTSPAVEREVILLGLEKWRGKVSINNSAE